MNDLVLIISASGDDIRALEQALGNARNGPFVPEGVATLVDRLRCIRSSAIDAILAI